MSRVIVLDSGPLGLATKRRGVAGAESCRAWIRTCLQGGAAFKVPAIAYYEVARELDRIGNLPGLDRLNSFCEEEVGRYVPLTDQALRLAIKLWARSRNAGTPTSDPRELDCDVLLAAQALTIGIPESDLIIATTNVGHLSQFTPAALWTDIEP